MLTPFVVPLNDVKLQGNDLLAQSGVQPWDAMELMRHTDIRLTTGAYTDPKMLNTLSAVRVIAEAE